MKKLMLLFLLLILIGCSGGGWEESNNNTNSYIGFENSDFSNKTIYLVELNQWSKGVFNSSGLVQGYAPNQTAWYQEGTWAIQSGKLFFLQ